MQRGARRLGFRSWTLTALVLASAVLTLTTQAANSTLVAAGSSSTAGSVCAATTCKLSNGGNCNRTVAGCPICLQFQAASNVYTCTTVMKTTKTCPEGFSTCSSAVTVNPSPTPSPTPSPNSSPSLSSSSSSSTLGQVRAAGASSDGSGQSESGQLHTASVVTEAPETTVSTGTSDSSSSFPTWIVIGAGTVVGCIIAAVIGTKYAARKNARGVGGAKNPRDSDSEHSSTKDVDTVLNESHGSRMTTAIDFSESALDLNSTTSKAAYTAVDRSTRSAEGSVLLKSDSWRHTNTSSKSVGPSFPTQDPMPTPVQGPLSHHSFRGSQHISKMLLDDLQGPLDASQLTTEVSKSYRSEGDDTFGMSAHSEWTASGFYDGSNHSGDTDLYSSKISILGDDDGGNGSGNTEFYSSKISVLGDHDDDDFLRRNSERVDRESVAKWKQKFYVEL